MKTKYFMSAILAGILLFMLLPVCTNRAMDDEVIGLIQTGIICLAILLMLCLVLEGWQSWLKHCNAAEATKQEEAARQDFLARFDKAVLRSLSKAEPPKKSDEDVKKEALEKLIAIAKKELGGTKPPEGQKIAEECLQKIITQMEQLLLNKPNA